MKEEFKKKEFFHFEFCHAI